MTAPRVTDTEYQAALERVRAYREQLNEADRRTDQGSLDRARDLELLYQEMRWVDELPAPKNKVWRGRSVDPRSRNRFATWVLQQTGLVPSRVRQLHLAEETVGILVTAVTVIPDGEWALRPLRRLDRQGYGDHLIDVYKRALELAEGDVPTYAHTSKAVRDFLAQYSAPQRQLAVKTHKAEELRKKAIRIIDELIDIGAYGDAQQVLREAAEHLRKAV